MNDSQISASIIDSAIYPFAIYPLLKTVEEAPRNVIVKLLHWQSISYCVNTKSMIDCPSLSGSHVVFLEYG